MLNKTILCLNTQAEQTICTLEDRDLLIVVGNTFYYNKIFFLSSVLWMSSWVVRMPI